MLIAEDELSIRWLLAEYLRGQGYKVVETTNAADAMSLFERGVAVDVVIADFSMPGGPTGYMLAAWLELRQPSVPVIVVSGLTSRAPGFVRGPLRRFVSKPYDLEQMAQLVRGFILGASADTKG